MRAPRSSGGSKPAHRVVATLLAALLAGLLAAPVLAHEGDGRLHVQTFQEARGIKARTSPLFVSYEMDRLSEPTMDTIRIRFDVRSATVTYDYRREEALSDATYSFRWVLDEVLEYRDLNGNGEFDGGIDRVERAYPLRQMKWNVSAPERVLLRGQTVVYVLATGNFGPLGVSGPQGLLHIQFAAHGVALRVAKAEMHPQDIKMNWNFANFPFRAKDTKFAMVTRLELPRGGTLAEEVDRATNLTRAALVSSPGYFAFADWDTVAKGNSSGEPPQDREIPARIAPARRLDDGYDSYRITFSYPRADLLLSHDPTLGFEYAPAPRPPILPWSFFVTVGTGALAIGVGLVGWRHYKRTGSLPFLTRGR